MAGPSDLPPLSAPARLSRCREPLALPPWWHSRQLPSRIGKDLRVEFDAAGLHGFHLALVGDDLLGDEMVDRVVRREAGGQGGDGGLGRAGQPLLRGGATFLPVFALTRAGGGAGGGVDFAQARLFLRGVGGPAGVVVGRRFGGRRKQLPVGATGKGDRGDGLAEFRTTAADHAVLGVDDEAYDGFEDHAVLAALGFEFDPRIAVAGRGEAEVAAEVEELVLILDGFVIGAGGREGRLRLQLAVDEERRGAATAEEQAMLAGRQLDRPEGAEEIRMAAFRAYAGVDVFFGHASEPEGGRDIAIGHGGSLGGPDVGGRLPVFAEFDAHLAVRDRGPVDLRGLAHDFRRLGGLGAAGAVVAGVGAGADLGDLGLGDGRQGGGEASGDLRAGTSVRWSRRSSIAPRKLLFGRPPCEEPIQDRSVVDDGGLGAGSVRAFMAILRTVLVELLADSCRVESQFRGMDLPIRVRNARSRSYVLRGATARPAVRVFTYGRCRNSVELTSDHSRSSAASPRLAADWKYF